MRILGLIACSTLAASLAGVVGTPVAGANDGVATLNGTYIATSNGDWAKRNEIFRNEASVRSTWTITSSCSDVDVCTGTVTSDNGWSAPMTLMSAQTWWVKRTIPNWAPCADGTAASGLQIFRFYPVDNFGAADPHSNVFAGTDTTNDPSGSCGRSQPLMIAMPFKLEKVA